VFANSFGQGKSSRRFSEEELAGITAPTLVLWSEKNPGTGPDVGRYLATLIPGAQCYVMEDAAHWPQWEHPEEHDKVVLDFLRGS
jgi:pimeloyl-ACP methyl ester carboxylesterase